MDASHALTQAVAGDDWNTAKQIVDDNFFRLLFEHPEQLVGAFNAAPDRWYEDHPRNAMSRAIATVVTTGTPALDPAYLQHFSTWVESQSDPALRDVLGLRMIALRDLISRGWFEDGSAVVDGVLELIRAAPVREEGLHDVQPRVLLSSGIAKLLNGELDSAAACFSEAIRWSTLGDEHPFALYARGHLALVHALEERYVEASALLINHPTGRSAPTTLQYHYESPGMLARLLCAAATVDEQGLRDGLAELDPPVLDGDLGWIALHARTQLALISGNSLPVIHQIQTVLSTTAHRTHAGTIAGSVLRSDLAALYQAAGDVRAADQILTAASRGPNRLKRDATIPAARQALLRGRPHQALTILQQPDPEDCPLTPARYTSTGAVLYATAELAVTGEISAATLELATATVNHHRAHIALMNASPELRELLLQRIAGAGNVPSPWTYRARVKLTPREHEVLRALHVHPTINLVAASLHVSPNTAKTHVRALYRKLGAHTRDEALWLGNE